MQITTVAKIAIIGSLGAGSIALAVTQSKPKYPHKIQRILDWSKKHGRCTIHLVQSYDGRKSYPPYENNWSDSVLDHVWDSLTKHNETKSQNESNCKSSKNKILRLSNQSANNKWKKDTNSWE